MKAQATASLKRLFLLLPPLIACGGNPSEVGEEPDASVDAPVEAPYMGTVCCQITDNLSDDPVWNSGLYGCDSDSGVPMSETLTWVPWLCGVDDGGEVFDCEDPRCVPGVWCQGVNGYGTVTNCQQDN